MGDEERALIAASLLGATECWGQGIVCEKHDRGGRVAPRTPGAAVRVVPCGHSPRWQAARAEALLKSAMWIADVHHTWRWYSSVGGRPLSSSSRPFKVSTQPED